MAETREQMAAKLDRMARFNYAHSPSTAAALRAGAAALRAQGWQPTWREVRLLARLSVDHHAPEAD